MFKPQSCARIISVGGGGSGEGGFGHGCPFYALQQLPGSRKDRGDPGGDSDANIVSKKCSSYGRGGNTVHDMLTTQKLSVVDIEDIVSPLEGGPVGGSSGGIGSAVSACSRHFSATHRWVAGSVAWSGDSYGRSKVQASPNGWLAASTRSQPDAFLTQRINYCQN